MIQHMVVSFLDKDMSLVLDGASGTLLESYGVVLHPKLWSAIALKDNPDAVRKMHRDYFDNGANIASTITYQASFEGFKSIVDERKAIRQLFIDSVTLAREAAAQSTGTQPKLVAAALGPYGSYLCNGAEYSGDYANVSDQVLWDFHSPRLEAVMAGRPDIILFETIPTLQEIKIIAQLVADVEIPVWLSLSVKFTEDKDGAYKPALADSTSIETVLQHCGVFQVLGANCFPVAHTIEILEELRHYTAKPLIVYPNSGETYDAVSKSWNAASPKVHQHATWDVSQWHKRGARIVGGCCRSTPLTIRDISEALQRANATK